MRLKKIDQRIALFLLVFLVFSTFSSFSRLGTNPSSRFMLTKSIVKYQQLSIVEEDVKFYTGIDYAIYDGKNYSDKPPGISFISVPFYVIGDILYKTGINLPTNDSYNYPGDGNAFFLIILFMIFINSLAVVVLFDLLHFLKFSKQASLIVSLAFAFATLFWFYSTTLFSHSFTASLLIFTFYFLIKKNLFTSGILLGFSILIEYTIGLFLPIFFIYFLIEKKNLKNFFSFYLPVLFFLSILAVYNYLCFGNFFTFSYFYSTFKNTQRFNHPIADGLYQLTISTWRGLFFYNPILLLSIPGAVILFKKHRNQTILFILTAIVYLVTFSMYSYFTGGLCYGPRQIVPMIPSLILLAVPMFDKNYYQKALKRLKIKKEIYLAILSILIFISFFHTFLGIFVNPYPYPEIEKNPIYNIEFKQLLEGKTAPFSLHSLIIFLLMAVIDVLLLIKLVRYNLIK